MNCGMDEVMETLGAIDSDLRRFGAVVMTSNPLIDVPTRDALIGMALDLPADRIAELWEQMEIVANRELGITGTKETKEGKTICENKDNGGCILVATIRVFWPGAAPIAQCRRHAQMLKAVATTGLGMPVHMEPINHEVKTDEPSKQTDLPKPN